MASFDLNAFISATPLIGGSLSCFVDPSSDPLAIASADPFGTDRQRVKTYTPVLSADLVYDRDGLAVPPLWQGNRRRWDALPLVTRQTSSQTYIERLAQEAAPKAAAKPYAARFTTDYAIRWGKRQGWKLIEREVYDYRTKRHHDLELGVDAIFDDMVDGRIGVQGAGRSERREHYQRFLDRGGVEKSRRRHIRVCYVEFDRGTHEPAVLEWWA